MKSSSAFRLFGRISCVAAAMIAFATTAAQATMYTDGYQDLNFTDPTATYQEWTGGFTKTGFAATGANLPSIVSNPNSGTINAGSPIGFITSTNGIYHFSQKITPTVVVPNYGLGAGYNTRVVWQVSIDRIGEWLDLNSVTVTPAGGSPVGLAAGLSFTDKVYDAPTSTWLYPTALTTSSGTGTLTDLGLFAGAAGGYGEGPDYTKGYLFEWTLPGNASSYTFNATARGTSTSFKGTQVDTLAISAAVPEPATLGALAIGGLLTLYRRRGNR